MGRSDSDRGVSHSAKLPANSQHYSASQRVEQWEAAPEATLSLTECEI